MKKLAAAFVITGTALIIAPQANAGQHSAAIDGCKAAIAEQVGGDKVRAYLGDVRKMSGARVQIDFKVKIGSGAQLVKKSARCLATRKGEVLDLVIS